MKRKNFKSKSIIDLKKSIHDNLEEKKTVHLITIFLEEEIYFPSHIINFEKENYLTLMTQTFRLNRFFLFRKKLLTRQLI